MKRFKDLVPGNTLYMICIDPDNNELLKIISCIVDNINHSGTVIGVRFVDPNDSSKTLIDYFRVNPESYINDSLKEYKEHRVKSLFETKNDAIDNYIYYCEDKIKQYQNNITKAGKIV